MFYRQLRKHSRGGTMCPPPGFSFQIFGRGGGRSPLRHPGQTWWPLLLSTLPYPHLAPSPSAGSSVWNRAIHTKTKRSIPNPHENLQPEVFMWSQTIHRYLPDTWASWRRPWRLSLWTMTCQELLSQGRVGKTGWPHHQIFFGNWLNYGQLPGIHGHLTHSTWTKICGNHMNLCLNSKPKRNPEGTTADP